MILGRTTAIALAGAVAMTEPTWAEAAPGPSTADTAGWDQPIAIASCPYAAPALPAQSEVALDATLLVRVPEGIGSAFMISADGFALTAAHVVGRNREVDVVAHGGARLRADVVRVDEPQDVALLKVRMDGPSSCLRPLERHAALGSDVFILGSPAGEELSFSVSKGIVSGYRSFGSISFVQLDASVNPGNSGGPAVDAGGQVVGIASWKVSHVSMEGLAFAVPADVAVNALGIVWEAQSDAEWAERRGRITSEGRTALTGPGRTVPRPAPSQPASSPGYSRAQMRRDRLRTGFIVTGSIALASGAITIAGTYGAYRAKDSMTSRQWNVVRGFNTAGWTLSIAGAALLATGLIVPKRVKKRSKDTALKFGASPRGVSVWGAF